MFVRLVRFKFGPGKHAAAQALADELVPAISTQPGCQSVVCFGDETDGEYGLYVLWDTQEHADAAAAIIRPRLNEGLAGNVQAPPDVRLFQVLAQAG